MELLRERIWLGVRESWPRSFLLRARDFRISGCGLAAALRVAVPLLQGARAITVQPTIIIVDDDLGIRESLEGLLRSVGLQVRAPASVPEFVKEGRPEGPACLVLDVRLPGSPGLFRGVLNQRIMRIILTRHLSIRRGNSTA
jgi:hypothetical protein